MRHRPAWFAGAETQLPLPGEAVDLVHHTIDIEGQRIALLGDGMVKIDQTLRAPRHRAFFAYRQPQCGQRIEHRAVRGRDLPTLHLPQPIGKKGQRSFRGQIRVELPDAARRAVAGIDQGG